MADEAKPVTKVVAIRKYFFSPAEKMADIIAELRPLSDEEKTELAEGAAKELGLTLAEG